MFSRKIGKAITELVELVKEAMQDDEMLGDKEDELILVIGSAVNHFVQEDRIASSDAQLVYEEVYEEVLKAEAASDRGMDKIAPRASVEAETSVGSCGECDDGWITCGECMERGVNPPSKECSRCQGLGLEPCPECNPEGKNRPSSREAARDMKPWRQFEGRPRELSPKEEEIVVEMAPPVPERFRRRKRDEEEEEELREPMVASQRIAKYEGLKTKVAQSPKDGLWVVEWTTTVQTNPVMEYFRTKEGANDFVDKLKARDEDVKSYEKDMKLTRASRKTAEEDYVEAWWCQRCGMTGEHHEGNVEECTNPECGSADTLLIEMEPDEVGTIKNPQESNYASRKTAWTKDMSDVSSTAMQLMQADNDIWESQGWTHGGMVDDELFRDEISKFLTDDMPDYVFTDEDYDILEDYNYHTLNSVLEDLKDEGFFDERTEMVSNEFNPEDKSLEEVPKSFGRKTAQHPAQGYIQSLGKEWWETIIAATQGDLRSIPNIRTALVSEAENYGLSAIDAEQVGMAFDNDLDMVEGMLYPDEGAISLEEQYQIEDSLLNGEYQAGDTIASRREAAARTWPDRNTVSEPRVMVEKIVPANPIDPHAKLSMARGAVQYNGNMYTWTAKYSAEDMEDWRGSTPLFEKMMMDYMTEDDFHVVDDAIKAAVKKGEVTESSVADQLEESYARGKRQIDQSLKGKDTTGEVIPTTDEDPFLHRYAGHKTAEDQELEEALESYGDYIDGVAASVMLDELTIEEAEEEFRIMLENEPLDLRKRLMDYCMNSIEAYASRKTAEAEPEVHCTDCGWTGENKDLAVDKHFNDWKDEEQPHRCPECGSFLGLKDVEKTSTEPHPFWTAANRYRRKLGVTDIERQKRS